MIFLSNILDGTGASKKLDWALNSINKKQSSS